MPTSECLAAACTAGMCGTVFVALGTPTSAQTVGDCHENVCDGAGNIENENDDSDLPADDGNPCTSELCTLGVASHPAASQGTTCSVGGGVQCDGQSVCTQTFTVVRVGTGTGSVPSTTTAAFLDTYYPLVGAAPVSTVALPTTAAGLNQQLTLLGTATSEGGLSRSADGHYLTLAGYATATGASSTVTNSTTTPVTRVVGRVDAAGNVDTSTHLGTAAFSGSNVRGATSADGTSFWVTGTSSGTNGGVWYVTLGATGGTAGGTQVATAPNNSRMINVYGGQLYGSAGSSGFTNVFTVGAGLPTATGATSLAFPGMPTTGASPYGFVIFDLDNTVTGVDTLFVADSSAGVQRWTFNGTTWTKDATFTALTSGCLGVTGWVTGTGVTLIATTSAGAVHRIDVPTTGTATDTLLLSAATGTALRGVALAPH